MLTSELPEWLFRAFALMFGGIWGSFFNVAIHRWPQDDDEDSSVVFPSSRCALCKAPIAPKHNIPILSYLWLRGRTACCKQPYTSRYLWVEILSACLSLALMEHLVLSETRLLLDAALEYLFMFFFVGGLIISTFTDLEALIIPDEVSIGGTALGLATVAWRTNTTAAEACLGAGFSYLILQIVFVWGWEHLRKRRGMGMGDPKFLMYIGSFLGWKMAFLTLVIASVTGTVVGFAVILRDMKQSDSEGMQRKIPFGPFLALGALIALFFGETLISNYLALMKP